MTGPIFTNEDKENRARAYQHNAPFATPGPYQTSLDSPQEAMFRQWLKDNRVEFDPNDPHEDYDMRGYWKDTGGRPRTVGGDYPDTYKTPYDPSFSNESRYATKDNPFKWSGGGYNDALIDTRDNSKVFQRPSAAPSGYTVQPVSPRASIYRPAADPTIPGIPGATSVPAEHPPRYPTPAHGTHPREEEPTQQFPTPLIPGSHAQRPVREVGYEVPDHHAAGYALGRQHAPKFQTQLANVIQAHFISAIVQGVQKGTQQGQQNT